MDFDTIFTRASDSRIWGVLYRGDEIVQKLIVVMVAQLCECTKNHRIAHFKQVNYMACELYSDKAVLFKKPSDASDFHIP